MCARERPVADADVVLVQPAGSADHFAGVPEALAARGLRTARVLPGALPPRPGGSVRVVATTDVLGAEGVRALAEAGEAGARTMLVMDGIAEWRNVRLQLRLDAWGAFLRPAPVDVVACAGEACRALLERWGNRAVATGLPRLGARRAAALPVAPTVLVATANRAAFDGEERRALAGLLGRVRERLDALGVRAIWRLRSGLEAELGVRNDPAELDDALARSRAVLSTISTLLIEAMRAGRPAGLLHPFRPLPAQRGARLVDGEGGDGEIDEGVRALLGADDRLMRAQERALAEAHAPDSPGAPPAAERLAEEIARLGAGRGPARGRVPTRSALRVREGSGVARCVRLVACPGDRTDVARAIAALEGARREGGAVLLIAAHPALLPQEAWERRYDAVRWSYVAGWRVDHWRALREVDALLKTAGVERLVVDGSDVGRVLGTRLRARGVHVERMEAEGCLPTPVEDPEMHPAEAALRLRDHRLWRREWLDDPRGAEGEARRVLSEMGCERIALGRPGAGCDGVVVRWESGAPDRGEVRAWRAAGLAVVDDLRLIAPLAEHVASVARALVDEGCGRLAIFGTGAHTRRMERIFGMGLPIVGLLDDAARAGSRAWGLAVVRPEEAVDALGIDGVILSSDAFEEAMRAKCAPLRERGVRVVGLYREEERPLAGAPGDGSGARASLSR